MAKQKPLSVSQLTLFDAPSEQSLGDPLPHVAQAKNDVVPFGKHKGAPFDVLRSDPSYAVWLLNSKFADLQRSHPGFFAYLVAQWGIPDRTPEHNRLQNLFLNDEFALRFAVAARPEVLKMGAFLQGIDLRKVWRAHVHKEFEKAHQRSKSLGSHGPGDGWLGEARDALCYVARNLSLVAGRKEVPLGAAVDRARVTGMKFEDKGADVRFSVASSIEFYSQAQSPGARADTHEVTLLRKESIEQFFRVEVKPIIGDDYPSVLRAMKANDCSYLLVDQYVGEGATWPELVKVFWLSRITVLTLDDVARTEMPDDYRGLDISTPTQEEAEAVVMAAHDELLASRTDTST